MIAEFSGFYQALDNINMDQVVLRRIADQVRRIFTPQRRLDDALPKLAHLNDAAIRVTEMFPRAIDDRALADLGRGVLSVDRRHVVLLARAAHERRRFGSRLFLFVAPLASSPAGKISA